MPADVPTLKDVCSLIVDCEHKTAPEAEPGREFGYSIGTPNIRSGRMILSSAKRVDEETFWSWSARAVLQKNDIILTREAPAGEAALVDGTVPVCLGQRTVCLRPNPDVIIPRYLHYRLLWSGVQEIIHSRSEGSTVAHLNVKDIRGLALGDLPDLRRQEATAALLGALDDKIAANDRIARTAFDLSDLLYLKVIGDAVRTVPLGDVMELKYGKALPSGDRTEGDFPVYGSGGVTGTHDQALVEGPGIIVGRKGTVGAVYWSEQSFFPIDTTFYVALRRDEVPLEFAFHMLRHLGLDGMNSDSAVPGLNRGNALALPVRLPDHAALRRYHQEARPLFALRTSLSVQSGSLSELRDTLLPKLMSGETRLRDAERVVEGVL
jgi:type I restriction enzyme, S subunit